MDFRHYYTYLDQRLSKGIHVDTCCVDVDVDVDADGIPSTEANPLSYLPVIEDVLRDLLADKLENEEHIRYLLRTAIPKFIPTLLSRQG